MISIITPVYNSEKYIEACINNVIGQNCSGIEHLIIDGGSTDRTTRIIEDYSSRYEHIRWTSEKDSGQSEAINKGLAMAHGEVIGILNADDFYQPGVLVRVSRILQSVDEPAFVVGNCVMIDKAGNPIEVNKPKNVSHVKMLLGKMIQPYPNNPSSYFYHKSLHESAGEYSLDDHYHMDIDMVFRLLKIARVYYFDEHWGNFRLMDGTKTGENIRSGLMEERQHRIVRKYQNELSGWEKLWVLPIYTISRTKFFITAKYFIQNPDEFFPRLFNRLRTSNKE